MIGVLSVRSARRSLQSCDRPAARVGIDVAIGALFLYVLISPFLRFRLHGLVAAWSLFFLWVVVVSLGNETGVGRFRTEFRRRRVELAALGAWLLVICANAVAGRGYTGRQHLIIAVTITFCVLLETYYAAQGPYQFSALVNAFLLMLTIEMARSLPTLWSFPLLPRRIMLEGGQSEMYAFAMNASVGEYGFYTACALMTAVLVARAMVLRGWRRTMAIVTAGLVLTAIALATFAGAIMLMLLGFAGIVVATTRRSTVLRNFLVVGFFICVGIVGWAVLFEASEQMQYILTKVENQVLGIEREGIVEGDRTLRAPLWLMSIQTIIDFPLLGVGPSTGELNPNLYTFVGGHSSWLDLPAEYGLAGFACFVAYFVGLLRRATKLEAPTQTGRVMRSARGVCLGLFILGGMYNPVALQLPTMVVVVLLGGGGVRQAVRMTGGAP